MISYYTQMVETDVDRDKITYIYENFYAFMVYTAKKELNGHEHLAEDAVHAAMIKIIENIGIIDFADLKRVKNLCGVIARNKAKDMCKQRDNQNSSLEDEILEPIEDSFDPEEIVIKRDMYDIIVQAIYSLSETYRDVCLLKYISGLKEREIAEVLDLPPKTVGERIYRARLILRRELRKKDIHV